MTDNDLVATERSVFRTVTDTGLWDVFIASVVAIFAIAPKLSVTMGDFWSSAVFLPVWAVVYAIIRILKERVVVPRVGVVRFGAFRRKRLWKFTVVMLAVNVIAFVLGIVAFLRGAGAGSLLFPMTFSLTVLLGFSLAAYFLDIRRFFVYGVLLAIGPLVGEWLFRQGYVLHHGFPVVFGAAAILMAVVGMTKFTLLVRSHPPVAAGPSAKAHG